MDNQYTREEMKCPLINQNLLNDIQDKIYTISMIPSKLFGTDNGTSKDIIKMQIEMFEKRINERINNY